MELMAAISRGSLTPGQNVRDYLILVDSTSKQWLGDHVDTLCEFNYDDTPEDVWGSFAGLDQGFISTLTEFELRLCVRKISSDLRVILPDALEPGSEEYIVSLGLSCGDSGPNTFPRFALSILILGRQLIDDLEIVDCPDLVSRSPNHDLGSPWWQIYYAALERLALIEILQNPHRADAYLMFEHRILAQGE